MPTSATPEPELIQDLVRDLASSIGRLEQMLQNYAPSTAPAPAELSRLIPLLETLHRVLSRPQATQPPRPPWWMPWLPSLIGPLLLLLILTIARPGWHLPTATRDLVTTGVQCQELFSAIPAAEWERLRKAFQMNASPER